VSGARRGETQSDFLEKEVNPEVLSEALVAEIDAKTELLKATMARKKPS
jgi:hypothetical protein